MITIKISVAKIGALIGPGGKNIKKIIEATGADVNVEDDGTVFILSADADSMEKARSMVEESTAEVEVGRIYKGKVTRIQKFGAFVEVLPGKDGLVHISQMGAEHVERVEDVMKEGDEVTVKVMEIDSQGRVNLTCNLDQAPGRLRNERSGPPRPSRPRGRRYE